MSKIEGNTKGISKKNIGLLNSIYNYTLVKGQIGSLELIEAIYKLSQKIDREIAIYINRNGQVKMVSVGERSSASIPFLTESRSLASLSKLGCIHTHPKGNSTLSVQDYTTLDEFRLDYMCAIGSDETGALNASLAFLKALDSSKEFKEYPNLSLVKLLEIDYLSIVTELDKQKKHQYFDSSDEKETAILFVPYMDESDFDMHEKISELTRLTKTAGIEILEISSQKRKNTKTILGAGKIDELALMVNKLSPTCLIIDESISPSQEKQLSETLGIKIIDRTTLILDIFAQRARSNEGKLQVELAQLRYLMPRIMGQGLSLSRTGGGIGARGPGETKLETDRRHIRRRIYLLEKQLEKIKAKRSIQKQSRKRLDLPTVSLVGYTNAGKSSLLNLLGEESIYADDLLFATLDPTTRLVKIDKESSKEILLTDTVGFISNLPHELISAFKSTLEEVLEADLLLHVIDLSNPNWEKHVKTVNSVLDDLNAMDKSILYIFNKVDLLEESERIINFGEEHLMISTKGKIGIDELKSKIKNLLYDEIKMELFIPYESSKIISDIYSNGKVLSENHLEKGTELEILIPSKKEYLFADYKK